ncbi:MAG: DUF4238 domain-containing protein [Rhodopseudomonas sp.]|uniref:DUF4238 domain-containing protein n=1 Tax=Rhodopseudomonas sp. TaxID=1078 RepID=UPI0018490B0B|nr:DUF4238 domain-containing protein [Rhodopseudomonas sp.]NVN88634.1 DUF4238 domain-containing protein [Rhodopseudomonas sp.]
MAVNKNQHYVPRVHLKPFTLDGAGLAINILNIDRMKPIENAPVRSQCSGDYFYGKDERLERAINSVESPYGEVIRFLSGDNAAVNPKIRIVILRFVLLQHMRTEAASRKAAEMTAAMFDVPGSDIPIPSMQEAMKIAVQTAMIHFADSMSIVDDLKVCIARNRTDRQFVTSDDPAVLTNRLHLQRRHKGLRSFGVKTAGAVFLLPLSPSLCAIVYDSAIYHTLQRAGWIDVIHKADVDAINEHQILNCMANLYYRDWDERNQLLQQVLARRHLRPERRHTIVHAALDYTTERGSRYVVKEITDLRDEEEVLTHVKTNHPAPSSWPSFLRFRPDAKAYSNNTGAGLTRKWCLEQGFVTGRGYQKVRI